MSESKIIKNRRDIEHLVSSTRDEAGSLILLQIYRGKFTFSVSGNDRDMNDMFYTVIKHYKEGTASNSEVRLVNSIVEGLISNFTPGQLGDLMMGVYVDRICNGAGK